MNSKISLGISACLLGERVRYDAEDQHNPLICTKLHNLFDWVKICPEVGIGMSVPRPPIRLIDENNKIAAIGVENSALDVTEQLQNYAQKIMHDINHICGFVFMQKSPSCGVESTKIYSSTGDLLSADGRGIFANTMINNMPWLPVIESWQLENTLVYERFFTQVYCLHDWNNCLSQDVTGKKIIEFYSRYKYLIMATHPPSYKVIGKHLAQLNNKDLKLVAIKLRDDLLLALHHIPTVKNHINTLMHLQGYLKHKLTSSQKIYFSDLLNSYRQGDVSLSSPRKYLQALVNELDEPYLQRQVYWLPFAEELN